MGEAEVVLDLSRLLSRVLHPTPTGIDRVELAYARTLLRRVPERLAFCAVHPAAGYGRLPRAAVERFLDATERRWEQGDPAPRRHAAVALWSLRPRAIPRSGAPRVLLQASPSHFDQPATVAAKLAREGGRFVALVHDVIPVSHPEYARPDGAARHRRRLDTLAAHADALLVNSHATAAALRALGMPAACPIRVAPLSPGAVRGGGPAAPAEPYFVALGTIEPRKNHLLLLNLWRALAAEGGDVPTLLLVGRRGWEMENVADMLDRCPALAGHVVELGRLPDRELRPLLRGARAMLMPSFAEGFGLPVAEALALGVPVVASDLPAHREAGGDVPEYLDPLDGSGWRTAIAAYAAADHPRRRAQLDRLAGWRATSWDEHVDIVLALIEQVSAC